MSKSSIPKKCSINGCKNNLLAKSYCATHYRRNALYGGPLVVKQVQLHIDPKERFFKLMERVTESGCWLWTGTVGDTGYGWIHINGGRIRAHRYSWKIHMGDIPAGMYVLHKCDVRLCVNPGHLFLGTHQDNMRDATIKGRMSRGEKCGTGKLSNNQALEIKRRLKTGEYNTLAALGVEYGVSGASIEDIKAERTWRHL